MSSTVHHPPHYNAGKFEVIEIIEDQGLGFCLGNAVKYICRAGKKDPSRTVEDLEKAVWYLKREIETRKAKAEGRDPTRPNDMNPGPLAEPVAKLDQLVDEASKAFIAAAAAEHERMANQPLPEKLEYPSLAQQVGATKTDSLGRQTWPPLHEQMQAKPEVRGVSIRPTPTPTNGRPRDGAGC